MNKSKIFLGVKNEAGNLSHIANALKTVNIEATSYSYTQHVFGYKADNLIYQINIKPSTLLKKIFKINFLFHSINTFIRICFLIQSLLKYNTFIFISTESILKNNVDLPILKYFRKKLVFVFIGCPERNPNDEININNGGPCKICNDFGMQKHLFCDNIEKKRTLIQYIEKYSNNIITLKDTEGFLIEKNKSINTFPMIVNQSQKNKEELLKKFDNLQTIQITHLPSNALLKGTAQVNKVMEKIIAKYGKKINYVSKRVSNHEVLQLLEKNHIIMDEFNSSHGLLAVEAWSRGCIVIGRVAEWFLKDCPPLPLVNIDINQLEETLIHLIENPLEMKKVAADSLDFYYKNNTPEIIGNYYKKTLNLK